MAFTAPQQHFTPYCHTAVFSAHSLLTHSGNRCNPLYPLENTFVKPIKNRSFFYTFIAWRHALVGVAHTGESCHSCTVSLLGIPPPRTSPGGKRLHALQHDVLTIIFGDMPFFCTGLNLLYVCLLQNYVSEFAPQMEKTAGDTVYLPSHC